MSSARVSSAARDPRVRPPDRRDRIVAAAASAFSRHGFHGARLTEIADDAGVSAPALYRHFAGKSDLLSAVTRQMAVSTAEILDSVPPRPDDPAGELAALLEAFTAGVLTQRQTGDLYRWEWRALSPDDRAFIREIRLALHRRVRGLLRATRPGLGKRDADVLTDAVFAVAASPSNHRVSLPRKQIETLIRDAALTAGAAELPEPATVPVPPPGLSPTARRETVLTEAVRLFADHGFHEVTIEQIAAAADLPPSGVYRHFGSKQAILVAALHRASERTTAAVATGLARTDSRDQALTGLAQQYARLCAGDPAIITVYRRCVGALGDAERADLRRQQRINVDEWATWLRDARPELSSGAARFLVHAALDVITDLTCSPHATDPRTAAVIALAVLRDTPA
ncbi:TetR/AcrR family transcriptional regulator [Gordonia sp. (in: high G+C Gram-positive bacteria)]|uniref:TetR/AcrR family transcriptional regulator n=1 Tax=Gordonia sp. (in: high G+C Gram-positive bacteria) TaxID=84139 RepID=UPI003528CB89